MMRRDETMCRALAVLAVSAWLGHPPTCSLKRPLSLQEWKNVMLPRVSHENAGRMAAAGRHRHNMASRLRHARAHASRRGAPCVHATDGIVLVARTAGS